MSKVLFGQSYYLQFDPKLWEAMQPYPPLGTLYAVSSARAAGFDSALFDSMLAESENEWTAALERNRPRHAVIYEDNFNYLSKMCLLRMREAAFRMIAAARVAGANVVVCGSDATDHAELYLEHGAHYVLLGEGEETLVELLRALERPVPVSLEGILGLAWQDRAGICQRSPRRPDITLLDDLPLPAWDLVDVEKYRARWMARHGYYSMNMVSTRGCPYHCNWCAKPIWGQRYNSRSPASVVAELRSLKSTYHPDHIWFADDIFGLKPGWVEAFATLVRAENAAVPFRCLMRPDLVSSSVVRGLRDAGCETVWIGAESGSQKILDAMEKGTTVEQIAGARRMLGAAGIRVGFFLQFGYPGETRVDIDNTIAMVRELLPDDIGISVSYPLPGTRFHERVKSQLGRKQNWSDSDDLAMLYQGPFPGDFYRTLHRAVHAEYRMRKGLRLLRDSATAFLRPRLLASIPRNWLAWNIHRRRLDRFGEGIGAPAAEPESR